ncbi:MAG: hypothetical protein C7B46_20500 [Sulfobacillus benefaciens]|uniref:Glutamate synthase domain-containing protein n=1 Tax=Sulfobacillus benefaciens TaxID=453960 RepID=A0A2T2WUG2_9FIRM|nr:MAG: hypothetical protein C7B46_20500 [Sulfobacillus benefaciens]
MLKILVIGIMIALALVPIVFFIIVRPLIPAHPVPSLQEHPTTTSQCHSTGILEHIAFNPVVPFSKQSRQISLTTTIGPHAEHPVILSLPIILSSLEDKPYRMSDIALALAQMSTVVGSATYSLRGRYLPEQRAYAERWILRFGPGQYRHLHHEIIQLADMVEIDLSPLRGITAVGGDQRPLPRRVARWIAFQKRIVMKSPAPRKSLPQLIRYCRDWNPKVPLGIKILASHYLEEDLAVAVSYPIDFITVTGRESLTQSGGVFGIPTAVAVKRARDWMSLHGVAGISLLASGGALTADDIAKLLALGADAVDIGPELLKTLIPITMAKQRGHQLDVGQLVLAGTQWLQSTASELKAILLTVPAKTPQGLNRTMIYARTQEVSHLLDLPTAASSAKNHVADLVRSLVAEYQRLIPRLQYQFALLSDDRHA